MSVLLVNKMRKDNQWFIAFLMGIWAIIWLDSTRPNYSRRYVEVALTYRRSTATLHGIKLLVFNKRMAMKLEASFSLTNINDSVKVIQLPLSKSIICGSQAPRSVWIIVIKYLQRGKISQFSCWKNVRACSSYDLTRGSYSLSPVLPGDVPIQVDGGHDRIQCVTAKPTN